MAQLSDYLLLATSEHQASPNYLAFLSIFLQGHVDNQNLLANLPGMFALNTAVGQQLDFVGARIGQVRESIFGVTVNDDVYRLVLKAVVAANQWDGTGPGAYAIWAIVFGPGQILLQDNMDMSMLIIWIGATLDPTTETLLTTGQLALKPAAVKIAGYFKPSVPGQPIFGLDVENSTISGLDVGAWMIPI